MTETADTVLVGPGPSALLSGVAECPRLRWGDPTTGPVCCAFVPFSRVEADGMVDSEPF